CRCGRVSSGDLWRDAAPERSPLQLVADPLHSTGAVIVLFKDDVEGTRSGAGAADGASSSGIVRTPSNGSLGITCNCRQDREMVRRRIACVFDISDNLV